MDRLAEMEEHYRQPRWLNITTLADLADGYEVELHSVTGEKRQIKIQDESIRSAPLDEV